MPPVTTAVVPVAGLGTRLLPATRAVPKEMLPVGGKPVVQHVVEELADSGIERVVFITARGKEAIEQHFGAVSLGMRCEYVIQQERRGLGDAVLCAEAATGAEPFAIALGDAILGTRHRPPVVARLARVLDDARAVCAVAVRDVPREQTSRYGIVSIEGAGERAVARVSAIVEKPDPASAPSTLAVAARYVMTPAIYDALRDTPPGSTGELELTDAMALLIAQGSRVMALDIGDLVRHDVGSHESYAAAFLAFALTDPDYGERLRPR